jgi:hypothetical protein
MSSSFPRIIESGRFDLNNPQRSPTRYSTSCGARILDFNPTWWCAGAAIRSTRECEYQEVGYELGLQPRRVRVVVRRHEGPMKARRSAMPSSGYSEAGISGSPSRRLSQPSRRIPSSTSWSSCRTSKAPQAFGGYRAASWCFRGVSTAEESSTCKHLARARERSAAAKVVLPGGSTAE